MRPAGFQAHLYVIMQKSSAKQAMMHPHLVDAIGHCLQRELSRSIHRLAVVRRSPAGAVDVDDLGHVADG